jgi:uncharacterized surface protein with fasciclin (FAS1) repeats
LQPSIAPLLNMRILRVVYISAFAWLLPLIVNGSLQGSPRSQVGWDSNSAGIKYRNDNAIRVESNSDVEIRSTTVIDLLSTSAQHTTLLHLLQRCKLVPSINLMQGLTLFAPTDQAWENWAKEKENHNSGTWAGLAQIIFGRPQTDSRTDDTRLADNTLFDTHQLLLYHMLNYTLPLGQHPNQNQLGRTGKKDLSRWVVGNISTETTLLFPLRHHHHRSPGHIPPPHPPWSSEGRTGTLGGHAQQIRLLFDKEDEVGPGRVQVDVRGRGGAGIWTGWEGNITTSTDGLGRPVAGALSGEGQRYMVGSNGMVIGIDRVLDPPSDLGEFSGFVSLQGRQTRPSWLIRECCV